MKIYLIIFLIVYKILLKTKTKDFMNDVDIEMEQENKKDNEQNQTDVPYFQKQISTIGDDCGKILEDQNGCDHGNNNSKFDDCADFGLRLARKFPGASFLNFVCDNTTFFPITKEIEKEI